MTLAPKPRTGGQILIDQLKLHGADTVFGVPGESYLAALDALYDARNLIRFISCRQEGGAAYMAEAYGKLTGRPGICFVTRGPGACNASIGIHTGFQDSTPMILLIGQVGRGMVEREAFQEIDYRRMYGPMAKWVAEIERADRIPELLSRAFHTAMAGRRGPVVLALPEDMLRESATVADPDPYRVVQGYPGAAQMTELRQRLARARRPFLLLGGGGWSHSASRDLLSFAEANDLPVGCAFRRQDAFDNIHRCYAGDVGVGLNPKLAERIKNADLLITVGPRLGEMTTSEYSLAEIPRPKQALVHVYPGAEELGRVYQADLPIVAGIAEFAAAARALEPVDSSAWSKECQQAHADYLDWLGGGSSPGLVDMVEIMKFLRERLPADAILTNGAGNYTVWAHRYYRFRNYGTQLGPTSGAMGYGAPAGVAAKLLHPDRIVVSFNGDGCFLMNGQELATALQYGVATVFIVVNNGMYGTIRMHQEREYPRRVIATDLINPDFMSLAQAYGAHGERVERTEEFAPAFERALSAGKAALIEIRLDPEAITPRQSLSGIRAAARR
ncbi:MAG TPA: thiamine pyrophosphate-binding protein [Alphaproteobacteria bacterium]|nr:thiamine pyrophosphate-binding protein [Alphaproteobacteria bacterium]